MGCFCEKEKKEKKNGSNITAFLPGKNKKGKERKKQWRPTQSSDCLKMHQPSQIWSKHNDI